jgi:hypothetical protein
MIYLDAAGIGDAVREAHAEGLDSIFGEEVELAAANVDSREDMFAMLRRWHRDFTDEG